MKFDERIQQIKDNHRPNKYHLDKFLLLKGAKKPFALILPGGGYENVCSFCEGLPYAKALNRKGIAAFVVYYRTAEKALCPAPLEDTAFALKYIIDHADRLNVDIKNYSVLGGHRLADILQAAFLPLRLAVKNTACRSRRLSY